MIFDESTDDIVFSSGRRAYAFNGTIGMTTLDLADRKFGLSGICFPYGSDGDLGPLDPADARELCDHMIQQWTKMRESLG